MKYRIQKNILICKLNCNGYLIVSSCCKNFEITEGRSLYSMTREDKPRLGSLDLIIITVWHFLAIEK